MAAYCSFGPATSTQHWSTLAERGWCERLVDIASPDSPLQLRLVLSPGPTPASRLLVPRRLDGMPLKQRNLFKQLEVSPQVGGGQDCHLAGSLGCAGRGLGGWAWGLVWRYTLAANSAAVVSQAHRACSVAAWLTHVARDTRTPTHLLTCCAVHGHCGGAGAAGGGAWRGGADHRLRAGCAV